MRPHFNQVPRQIQSNSSSAALPQQVPSSNMPLLPQMGLLNSQSPFALGNGQAMPMPTPNMQWPMLTQPGFMNAPNPFLVAQNNHLGMPQLGSVSQLGPQNSLLHNLNNVPMFPADGQFFPQHLNQNMGFQNQLQNVNQFVSMQIPGSTFLGNSKFGPVQCNGFGPHVNQNWQNLVRPTKDVNGSKPSCTNQQLQGNSCSPLKSGPQLSQNMQFMGSQGNSVGNAKGNTSNTNWKNFPGKNFTRNPKTGPPRGFQKSQFHHVDNAKRKHGIRNEFKAKGHGNKMAVKFGQANYMNQPSEMNRKSLALTYTEKEIQQWREDRRKNYPTNTNVEKKKSEKLSNSDDIDREAKMRREQLKDILAKQAELGVEVAEIPPYYLFDSEKQVHGNEENTRPLNKRERFQNQHDKKGRYNKRYQFAKKQKLADRDLSNTSSFNKRKPTLLQKLLSADIKRDRSQLLQVFRFMVMNSFFKDWPERPLKFPLVVVKESGCAGEVIEDKFFLVEKDASEHNSQITTDNFDFDEDDNRENQNKNIKAFGENDVDVDEDEDDNLDYHVKGKACICEENVRAEEEEGEIID